tara:strand:- start:20 stop:577 length:558 start_codon:yes stop_codon:yes gene_type:complete
MEKKNINKDLKSLIKNIKIVALDVDGILTDGKIHLNDNYEELKSFNINDGFGIKLLQDNDIKVALITGRKSKALMHRAKELKIRHIIQGREDKLTALKELLSDIRYEIDEVAYMGDDFPDLKAISASKLGATIPTADPIIKKHANWISSKNGGEGAVRELADLILHGKGIYFDALKKYIPADTKK